MFYNPSNALKRAEELIAANQQASALTILHDVIMSRKFKTTPITALEPIMLKFISLTVVLGKGKIAKEALHQYKNTSQNVAVTSIETVIKKFIELAEAQVTQAQTQADKITLDAVDDLEATETPESIILSTVSGEVSKDRTDRQLVTPWLKFLWEAYRTALDTLRNNARLELLYQSIANQAFQFCLKYLRKTEFRRLCDLLRQHLATSAKYALQLHSVNLNDPDTLQRHLDTRFVQLNAAAELELWQEAFRSVEDIHNLLAITKKPPKAFMMANYYEKIQRIFMVGENYLFHAAAWNKYYATVRQNKNLTEEEHQRMASMVLISALSIPIISASKTRSYLELDDNKPKTQRLTSLLRVAGAPSREALLKEALSRNIFSRVLPELKELYNNLEVHFHPLSICKKIEPIISKITKIPELAKYAKPLHSVILTRLLQQLSQVYATVKISSVVALASFPAPFNYDAHGIEKFIMNGCKKGELSIRINHQNSTLTFSESDLFSTTSSLSMKSSSLSSGDGARLSSTLPSEQMRLELVRLGKRLATINVLISPDIEAKIEAREKACVLADYHSEAERKANVFRRTLIEKKKEMKEYESAKAEREEAVIRVKRQQEAEQAEKLRLEIESKRRDEERLRIKRAEIEKQETKKLAEKLSEELKNKNLKINIEDLENLDADKLMAIQVKQLEAEKKELSTKLRLISKKHDYIERAYKKEEIELLKKDYEKQKAADLKNYNILIASKKANHKREFDESMKIKQRVSRMLDDYQKFNAKLEAEAESAYQAQVKEAKAKLEAAKKERRNAVLAQREAEAKRALYEKEEQEKRIRDRQAKENEIKLFEEKRLSEYDEKKRKLDEQAKRQADAEKRAEEKLRGSASTPPTSAGPAKFAARSEGAWKPKSRTEPSVSSGDLNAWRSKPRENSATSSAATTTEKPAPAAGTGKYVAPGKRRGV